MSLVSLASSMSLVSFPLTSLPTEVISLIVWDARDNLSSLTQTCKAMYNIANDSSKPLYWKLRLSRALLELPQIRCTNKYTLTETPRGKKMIINAGSNDKFYDVFVSKGKFVKVTVYSNRDVFKYPKCRYNIDNLIRNLDSLSSVSEILA